MATVPAFPPKPGLVPLGLSTECDFAKNVQWVFALNEAQPTQIREMVSGLAVAQQGTPQTPSMGSGQLGQSLLIGGTALASDYYYVAPPGIDQSVTYTIFMLFEPTSSLSTRNWGGALSNANSRNANNFLGSVSGNFNYNCNYGSAQSAGAAILTGGNPYFALGVTRSSTLIELYINGAFAGNNTNSVGSSPAPARDRFAVGGAVGSEIAGRTYLQGGINTDLSPEEIAEWAANPWMIFDWGL